jgi:hypothetical protein
MCGGEEGLFLLKVGSAGHLALDTPCLQPAGLKTSSPQLPLARGVTSPIKGFIKILIISKKKSITIHLRPKLLTRSASVTYISKCKNKQVVKPCLEKAHHHILSLSQH